MIGDESSCQYQLPVVSEEPAMVQGLGTEYMVLRTDVTKS